jgi:hypothetical protein
MSASYIWKRLRLNVSISGKYEVWDVHTDKHRWWVLTNPTNLYSQEHFPSLDYILSFHIGLALRIAAQSEKQAAAGSAEHQRFLGPWRRWEQTVQAIDLAEEAEDFQAIGMRCREMASRRASVHAMRPHPGVLRAAPGSLDPSSG